MIKLLSLSSFLLLLAFADISIADDIGTSNTGTGDIGRCTEDLYNLQLVVRDASDQAGKANVKHDDKVHCSNEPDHKDAQGEDCDDIEEAYQNKIIDLNSELRNLENQLKVVQLACGYDFALTNTGSSKKQ